jgi:hypothetical protein
MLSHRLHFFAPFVPFLVLAFCAQQAVPATQAQLLLSHGKCSQQKSKCKNTKTQRQQQQRT